MFITRDRLVEQHLRRLVFLCILIRALTTILALLASYLPPFDSSADILLTDKGSSIFKRWIATSLRWDAFHFLHIAQGHYQFEHEWAFSPGTPLVLRTVGWFINMFIQIPAPYGMLFGHFVVSTIVTCETIRTLYLLTMEHTQSMALSLMAGYLFLLSPSPATFHLAPYAEPWFALFSYKGMLYCAQKRWLFASLSFAFASMFRSNGVLLAIFLVWGMILEPFIVRRPVNVHTIFYSILLLVLMSLPFFLHQLSGFMTFCMDSKTSVRPSWCSRYLPLIYTHVQSHYWNVGFLQYWTIQQLPNFLISAPVLLLLLFSSFTHIIHFCRTMFMSKPESELSLPLLTPSLAPHAIHALVLTSMLLFAAHTQIILRLASSMPFTYWSAAGLFFEHPKWAKAWVAWSILWGEMSIVLWTTFLPPA